MPRVIKLTYFSFKMVKYYFLVCVCVCVCANSHQGCQMSVNKAYKQIIINTWSYAGQNFANANKWMEQAT
jgi:hypothetical protein